MMKELGKRIEHTRRQSECQESINKQTQEFRNRSQSLDGHIKMKPFSSVSFESDCETTYRIYESILRQGTKYLRIVPDYPKL